MVARDVLDPHAPGYWRWDWENDRRGEWVELDPGADVIVEGVGAVTRASIGKARKRGAVDTLWVRADAEVRKRRALKRDPYYAEFWDMWAAQETALARAPADVTVRRV